MGQFLVESGKAKVIPDIKDRMICFNNYLRGNIKVPTIVAAIRDFNKENPSKTVNYQLLKLNFYQVVNETPGTLLRNLKFEKAKELLLSGISVREVCIETGWLETSMMTIFKSRTGLTIKEFTQGKLQRDFVMSTDDFNTILRAMKSIDDKMIKKITISTQERAFWEQNIGTIIEFYRARMSYWSNRLNERGVRLKKHIVEK